jgi:hypothetical protein
MHNRILFVVGLIAATAIAAATLTPLSINPGAWQVTMATSINGMPPHSSSYTSCVRPADLTKYPFNDPNANCTWTVVSSTSTAMQANGTCTPKDLGTVQFAMQLTVSDPQHVQGTGTLNVRGPNGPITGNYSGSGKWLSARCSATGQ